MSSFPAKFNTKVLTYSAICIALAIVLHTIKPYEMPQGGSITFFSMFFITIIGYLFGPWIGILGGLSFGLLQLVVDTTYIVHPIQLLLDYPIAFACLGCSGFFANKKYGLFTGYVFGCFLRFLCHALSGYIFLPLFVPEGLPEGSNAILYTIIYNTSYIAPEVILTLIVLAIPSIRNAIKIVKKKTA